MGRRREAKIEQHRTTRLETRIQKSIGFVGVRRSPEEKIQTARYTERACSRAMLQLLFARATRVGALLARCWTLRVANTLDKHKSRACHAGEVEPLECRHHVAVLVCCKRCCFQQSECGASRPCQVPRGYGDRTFATSGRVYTIHEPCRAMWMRGASRRTRRYAWTVQCQGVFVLCWKCVPCARSVRLERVPVCFRTRPYHPSIACERNFRHPFTSDHRGADTRCRN